ncbi:unnamed protein product [Alopecurus aequalis]
MSPAVPPLEDDDLLSEILLRLPPQPSSLPRASAVSKSWRRLVSDPAFSRRFRRHHRRNALLLGYFHGGLGELIFEPTLESPNRVPPSRFSLQLDDADDRYIQPLGCRHGFMLLLGRIRKQVLVWSPITGDQHAIDTPPRFDPTKGHVNGAVLRSAIGDVQHFKVVLVVGEHSDELNRQILACVYSSETGVWGNLISTPIPYRANVPTLPAKLVGHSLHWLLCGAGNLLEILEFDLEKQRLAVIPSPVTDDVGSFTVMRAEGGGLAFLSVSGFTAQSWKRKTDSDGVASWVMGPTIELDKLLSVDSDERPTIHGFAEDNNLVFLSTPFRRFTVQVEPLQFKELPKREMLVGLYYPFESVYAAGI